MAKCISCGEQFVSIGNEICMECHDFNDPQPRVYVESESQEYVYEDDVDRFHPEDDYADDVSELQENEDFARDDYYSNYEPEDQFLDGMWEE